MKIQHEKHVKRLIVKMKGDKYGLYKWGMLGIGSKKKNLPASMLVRQIYKHNFKIPFL